MTAGYFRLNETLWAGCDDSDEDTASSGFTSSGPQAPDAQGAVAVTFVDPGEGCDYTGHSATIGEVTYDTKDRVIVDGEEGAEVSCSVTGEGTFAVSARAAAGANYLKVDIAAIDTSASSEAAAAPGTISYASPSTAGDVLESPAASCAFWFTSETNESVAAGRVWATFRCSQVVTGGSTCEIAESVFIFENCGP